MFMKRLSAALAACLALLPLCLNAEIPILPRAAERKLAEINATITIPEDWKIEVQNDHGVIVYQLAGKEMHPCLSITFTPDVKGRTELLPTQYAHELLTALKELGGELEKKDAAPFVRFRVTYNSEGEDEKAISVTDTALANDETSVLYFLTWQAAALADKTDALKSLRDTVLSSFKPDPKFTGAPAAQEDKKESEVRSQEPASLAQGSNEASKDEEAKTETPKKEPAEAKATPQPTPQPTPEKKRQR